jgi:putative glutathione S-transferase
MCPFAHRANVVRSLKGLHTVIQLVVLDPEMGPDGWFFSGRFGTAGCDPLYGFKRLKDLYLKSDPDYTGRFSVPMLWDKKTEKVVSKESADLMRMFYTSFDSLLPPELQELNLPGGGFFPNHLQVEINELNSLIHSRLNAGVYNVGLASSQEAYDQEIEKLFGLLHQMEQRLRTKTFLFGDYITESDLRLYTSIARFDVAYYTIFRCNLQMVRQGYPMLEQWYRRLYHCGVSWSPNAFKETTNFFHVRVLGEEYWPYC